MTDSGWLKVQLTIRGRRSGGDGKARNVFAAALVLELRNAGNLTTNDNVGSVPLREDLHKELCNALAEQVDDKASATANIGTDWLQTNSNQGERREDGRGLHGGYLVRLMGMYMRNEFSEWELLEIAG